MEAEYTSGYFREGLANDLRHAVADVVLAFTGL
jgi:hypothetical protein